MNPSPMSKWVILICLCLSISMSTTNPVAAQEITRKFNVSVFRFAGIHAFTDTQNNALGYYSLYFKNTSSLGLKIFDVELNQLAETTIESSPTHLFNTIASDGKHILVSLVASTFKPTVTYILFDLTGKEIARSHRDDADMLLRGMDFYPQIAPHPNGGFVISQSVKDKKEKGLMFQYLDKELKPKWTKKIYADKGTAHLYDLRAVGDQIMIFDATERMGNLMTGNLRSLDGATGAENYSLSLSNDDHTLFPQAMRIRQDGGLMVTGSFFKGNKIGSGNPKGLFTLAVDAEGMEAGRSLFDWKSMKPVLKTDVADWFFRITPEVWMHSLDELEDGTFVSVAELYDYGYFNLEGEDPYHRIRLLDFMLFKFDKQGQILETERIYKTHEMLTLAGDMNTMGEPGSLTSGISTGSLNRAISMKANNAFSYRNHNIKADGTINLQYMGYDAFTHYAYSMDAPISSQSKYMQISLTEARPEFISYLQAYERYQEANSQEELILESSTREYEESDRYLRGILPASPGKMMIYEFDPLRSEVTMSIYSVTD